MPTASSVSVLSNKYTIVTATPNGESVSTNNTQFFLVSEVAYGENLVGWRRIIASGGNGTTDLIGTRYNIVQTPAAYTARSTYPVISPDWFGEARCNGYLLVADAAVPFLHSSLVKANNLALTRYYSHLASVRNKFKGLVFTGELPELLRAIHHPAKALRNGIGSYLTYLKRGARLPRRKRLPFVRKTWLEYSFGWRPLIADVDDAIQSFYRSKQVQPLFDMVSGSGQEDFVEETPHLIDLGGGFQLFYSQRNEVSRYVKYYGVTSSYGQGSANTHGGGFNPVEFVPTLWELIPYSFLVDYFTNIGDIVSSWSYRFIGTDWTSKLVRNTASSEAVKLKPKDVETSPGSISTFQGTVGSVKVERVRTERSRFAALELPKFTFQCPGFSTKWVNILALSSGLSSARKSLNS